MNIEEIGKEYLAMKPLNPRVRFRDGLLSIQASSFHYCSPKHDHGPYTCVEVAYRVNGAFEKIPELGDEEIDFVYGYVAISDVISLLISEKYCKDEILKMLPR